MDTVSRRRTLASDRRTVRRVNRPTQRAGAEGDRRRLVQLLVSLALFLVVYVGRGVFPAQVEVWRSVIYSNVDFAAVFQEFSRAVSDGGAVGDSLEALCVKIFGGEPTIVLLGETPRAGLVFLGRHGVMERAGFREDEGRPAPSPSDSPGPEPSEDQPAEAGVITAVAQEYTDNGVKLPRNVSFAFYELGLSETMAPVSGPVTSTFGYRDSPVNGKNEFHLALDIGAVEGTEIGAFSDGVVRYIGESDEFGQYLKIDHANHVSSFYAHCSRLLVHKGDIVACGQPVALVGQTGNATGPHLHLTIEKDNIRLNPAYYVDPA